MKYIEALCWIFGLECVIISIISCHGWGGMQTLSYSACKSDWWWLFSPCFLHSSYEPEIGDLLVKETVNTVTWKCSELLLNTRKLFHTHRWSRRTKKISWLCNWRKIRMMCHKSHPAELSRRHPHCGLLQEGEDLERVNHVRYWILETQYDCSSSMHYW